LTRPEPLDAVVIGGGPAGAAIARLLAVWDHSVLVLDKGGDRARGLAESIPPSTRKLLAEIGVLDAVDRAGFCRTRGNTVWWASREARVETFGPGADAVAWQVFRPDFDRVLLDSAGAAGATVERRARVRSVAIDSELARVEYECDGRRSAATAKFVLDCSGRAGVLARRFRKTQPDHRTCGLVGVWTSTQGWDLTDETHTLVETFDDGWAWSVPTSTIARHAGVMVADAGGERSGRADLIRTYRALIARSPRLDRVLRSAALERVFACDASLYCSDGYAGPNYLLVGDAGSFIDPLSSFGVKKALASAWLGAIAVHTALIDPARAPAAGDFFGARERQLYSTHLRRSREFARAASEAHNTSFWAARAGTAIDDPIDADASDPAREPDVRRAFERIRTAPHIDLRIADGFTFEQQPVVRGREIVLEPTLAGGMRFAANVDLVRLAEIAPRHRDVPDLFEAYCRTCSPVPLPNVVSGLSLLVARGILHER